MRQMKKIPPLEVLPNGVVIPTEGMIIAIHNEIIKYRKSIAGRDDTPAIRDEGVITYMCDSLRDRPHKYKEDILENALYVSTETFYYIACQHPFHDANKSTAYISALLILYANVLVNNITKAVGGKSKYFGMRHKKSDILTAPKEAEEITRLAEAGKADAEIRRHIKRFLEKHIRKGGPSG